MKLLSVNVGTPRTDGARRAKTGIYKEPAPGPVFVGELGLEGDAVCNKKHHGGPDQAVYLYDAQDYAWWSDQTGREVGPGTFGENLTTQGVSVEALAVGDRLTIGEVELEATAPRIPCATLARRMDDEGFVARFLAARRPGAYFRVIRSGTVYAGQMASCRSYEGERVPLLELFDAFHARPDEATLRRFLASPLAERARAQKASQLDAILARREERERAVG